MMVIDFLPLRTRIRPGISKNRKAVQVQCVSPRVRFTLIPVWTPPNENDMWPMSRTTETCQVYPLEKNVVTNKRESVAIDNKSRDRNRWYVQTLH